MAKIYDIKSIPAELLPLVGGKARGLNSLVKFGFEVPEAFVVTGIKAEDDFADVAAEYTRRGMGVVSVRSSATLEDGADFSAAGQFSTILNVCGEEDVKQATQDCVDSLHNVTAENYSKTFLRGGESEMNVVVQKMVKARCAGVIFSKAPMRPGFVLVEAVPGLGENLVSGKMSAQQYRVRGNEVEQMPKFSVLSKEEAVALGKAGRLAEEVFGMPMDLEWAIDEDGTIQWLQARPITISESVTMNELDSPLDAVGQGFTTGNIGEMMPGAVTPLNISTNMYALDWGVKQTYVETGCCGDDMPPFSFIAPYYNHMFFNMTNMYLICHAVYGTAKDSLDVSICGQQLKDIADISFKVGGWQRLKNTLPLMKMVFGGKRAKEGMDKVIEALHFDLTQDADGIYKQILDNFDLLKWAQYWHYNASYYSGGQSAMLDSCAKDFKDKDHFKSLVAGCLTQVDEFESANILRMMHTLADLMIADEPETAGYDIEQLADYMDHRASAFVRKAYEEFMMRHGHRGIREPEIMSRPWRDNRESFLTSLKSVLSTKGKAEGSEQKPWTDYADEILSNYSGLKRRMVSGFIEKARNGVCCREYTKSKVILALDEFKQAYRQLSKLLVRNGVLPDEDCIYFLLQEEVGQLLAGDQGLVKKAMARRRLYPQQQALKFPYTTIGVPQPLSPADADPNATVFNGTPVSRGMASGVARIVRNEEDAAALQKGEIMVATSTDIGWSPYYSIVAGMVTEIGSALSHGVVVAREYALPTVVNAANAMELIQTGDIITIDGNTGKVFINKRKSA